MSSAFHLINIYVCTKFNFNPFCTFQDMAQTGIHYGWYVLPFPCLPSIYKPSFISIPFVLSKIWPGHTSIMTNTRLRGIGKIRIRMINSCVKLIVVGLLCLSGFSLLTNTRITRSFFVIVVLMY